MFVAGHSVLGNIHIHISQVCPLSRGLVMRLIAVHLPERIISDIQRLVDRGLYPNRSEAIRIAIRDLLKRELWERGVQGSIAGGEVAE